MDNRRYHGLDALRGVMMMLGIVIHAAAFYLAYPPLPIPLDKSSSPVFDLILAFIHSFRMPAFFVLAGFFGSLLVERYGLAGSLWNRVKRILLPLLLGLLTIVPLTMWITLSTFLTVTAGEHSLFVDPAQIEVLKPQLEALEEAGLPQEPGPVHLWFLYYLCYFYLLLPVCRAAVGWSTRPGLRERLDRLLASRWMLVAFGSVTAATLWPFKAGIVLEGFLFFTPHPPSLLYYGVFFVLGYAFHSYRGILQTFQRQLPAFTLLSLVLFPAALLASAWELRQDPASAGVHALAVVLHGFCTWALISVFAGVSLRYFDFESPWIRFISQSSYWVYLVHMPIVGAFAWALLPYALSPFVKFPIVVAATCVICFLSYQYLARTSWISLLLHGKRFSMDWPWREVRAARVER